MKLSIVTINYNNAEGLRRTLNSVTAQTYHDIEHIIIDGGSTDASVEVIKEYVRNVERMNDEIIVRDEARKERMNVVWSSESDKGIYNAMNHGIEIALGRRIVNEDHTSNITHNTLQESLCDYVQILNSGDLLAADDVTERMMAALKAQNEEMSRANVLNEPLSLNDGVAILYGNMLKSYDGKTIINRDTCGGDMYTPESFLYFYKGTLNHDCAYIRRDLFEKYGLYNEQMKICSDWEWYVRAIVLGGEKPVYTNIDVTIFDMNGVSESYGKNADIIKRERREYLESILPPAVLHDYDAFSFPILQYQRLKKHHLWGIVYFIERVLFKLEKWRILK